jgi:predicted HTH domain antitoxin
VSSEEALMTLTTISQSDLAKKTQEVVDRVQHGEIAVVESSGHEQAIVLDPLDFRLLRALAQCAIDEREREPTEGDPDVRALHAYLAEEISLGKTADLLRLSRFELQDRFLRLGVPLRIGPATLEEARAEVNAAMKLD